MTGILEWLGYVAQQIFPPWIVVPRTHVGVRQRNVPVPAFLKGWWDGVRIKDCGAGFIWKTPFLDEVWELPVTIESEDLENIEAETRDGLVYDVSVNLRWKVSNPIKATFVVSNYESSLKNEVRAVVLKRVNAHTGLIDVDKMEKECTELVRKIGADWGCFCQGITLNSCARPWEVKELRHSIAGDE